MKRKKIITNNKEVYNKFILLNFKPEVTINGVKECQINKILQNVNKYERLVLSEVIGENIIRLKKVKQFNFNIYLR